MKSCHMVKSASDTAAVGRVTNKDVAVEAGENRVCALVSAVGWSQGAQRESVSTSVDLPNCSSPSGFMTSSFALLNQQKVLSPPLHPVKYL